jgi:exodeoxyribonuclease VII large subunit
MRVVLSAKRAALEPPAAELLHLDPRGILQRGYAIVFDTEGNILKDVAAVAKGQAITAQLARGKLKARVEDTAREG